MLRCRVQLISVYSGNRLPRELVVQLCDEDDNPTAEENVRIQLTRDATALKVYTDNCTAAKQLVNDLIKTFTCYLIKLWLLSWRLM